MKDVELTIAFCSLVGAIIGLISAIIGRKKVIEVRHTYNSESDIDFNKKWYDKYLWLFVWILLFFPVGYYGLYKSRTVPTGFKFIIPVVHFFLVAASSKH